jgi:hypothetical protein
LGRLGGDAKLASLFDMFRPRKRIAADHFVSQPVADPGTGSARRRKRRAERPASAANWIRELRILAGLTKHRANLPTDSCLPKQLKDFVANR